MSRKYMSPYADLRRQDVWYTADNVIPTATGSYATPTTYAQQTGAGPATPGTTLRAFIHTREEQWKRFVPEVRAFLELQQAAVSATGA